MKILISILVLVVLNKNVSCYGSDTSPTINRKLTPEEIIHLLSEQVRNLIRTGDVDNGVPVLDPYEFQWRQRNFEAGEMFTANVNITDGRFTGLGDFRLQQLNFSKSEISIQLNIDIPSLKFYSEFYELDGNIYEAIPIKGQGIADIEIQNISLWGKVYLKQSTDGESILLDRIQDPEFSIERVVTNMNMSENISLWGKVYLKQSTDGESILLDRIQDPEFSIERVVSRTQFDNNIDDIISSMVEDLLAEYLTRFNKYIATSFSGYIPPYLNPTLDNYENWNLLATLLYDEIEY